MTQQSSALSQPFIYIALSSAPPFADALALRKALEDSLGSLFGLVYARTAVDVLVHHDGAGKDGEGVSVLRVASQCVPFVLFVKFNDVD